MVPTSLDDITSAGFTVTYLSFTVAVSAIFMPMPISVLAAGIAVAGAGAVGVVWARAGTAMQVTASAARTVFFMLKILGPSLRLRGLDQSAKVCGAPPSDA